MPDQQHPPGFMPVPQVRHRQRRGWAQPFLPTAVSCSLLSSSSPVSSTGCSALQGATSSAMVPPAALAPLLPRLSFFCPFSHGLSPRHTPVAEGLSCALRWGRWSRLEPAVSSMGQPRLLLTEASPAGPAPTPCQLCTVQLIISTAG